MHVSNVTCTIHCAHNLRGVVPVGHPCAGNHGHTYDISVEMAYNNVAERLLADFGDVKKIIKGKYCHKDLNEVLDKPSTAENLAEDIYNTLVASDKISNDVQFNHVTVGETSHNVTTYIPER